MCSCHIQFLNTYSGAQMVGHWNTDTEENRCQLSAARLTREWVQHPWPRVWRRRTDNSCQEPELHSMNDRCLQTRGAKARSRVRVPLSPGAHLPLSHRPPQGLTPCGPTGWFFWFVPPGQFLWRTSKKLDSLFSDLERRETQGCFLKSG